LSICRLDSICHSNLVSNVHSQWYMFEFDCVMMLLNLHALLVHFQSIWKCEDVSVLRLSLEFHFHLKFFSVRVSVEFFEILHCSKFSSKFFCVVFEDCLLNLLHSFKTKSNQTCCKNTNNKKKWKINQTDLCCWREKQEQTNLSNLPTKVIRFFCFS
jgi:hypothetical protein